MSVKALIRSNRLRSKVTLLALMAGLIGASLSLGGCDCAAGHDDACQIV
jgi:hypothetical protein